MVYRSHPQTLDELEDSIRTAFYGIDERLYRKVCTEAVKNRIRLYAQKMVSILKINCKFN